MMSKKEAISGTSANAYQDFKAFALNYTRTRVLIKNTHGANGLTYKIFGYMADNDLTDSGAQITAEAGLTFGNVYSTVITDAWDIIIVSIKSTVADTHATFKAFINRMAA